MEIDEFLGTLGGEEAPSGVSGAVQALWYAEKGDWERAHRIVQEIADEDGSWVHAHLHREEGDLGNANYWYGRSGRPPVTGDLREERHAIMRELLSRA